MESHILESNVFYAGVVRSGGNRADCHAYSVDYFDVACYDIFSALSDFSRAVHGLNSDGVVEVGNLDALNQDEIVAGYLAGLGNMPDYTKRDQGYWHGYMNGQVDKGLMPISTEQQQLARAIYKETFAEIFSVRH